MSITYCHIALTLKQVKGLEPNSCYKRYVQVHFIFFFFPFVFLPAVLLQGFCHCTSARPRTPIYRAFKRTNSYLQIYLVKP